MTDVAGNIDPKTVEGFGQEWSAFTQAELSDEELRSIFDSYFRVFPFDELPPDAEGFDAGCGSGRWADVMRRRVGILHCIDASAQALAVAQRRLGDAANVRFHHASVDAMPLPDGSQDFGYSLGVLHHVPDTEAALKSCVRKLKRGAPFLVYLYYRFDSRPFWYHLLWVPSDMMRRAISRLPFGARKGLTSVLAGLIYWPLTRLARMGERIGLDIENVPLSAYRNLSFYTMRTDALDRFGTRLERRFTRAEIEGMMKRAGLVDIVFSDAVPYWVACGRRA